MVLKSYAKINLSLSVKKKLKSGLHDIQSIYCLIDLHDKISIKKNKNKNTDQISFIGPFSKNINKSSNSVKKILDILRKKKIISEYYTIKVNKRIPVFAGFGGGTSNAATLLKNFSKKKKINKKFFNEIVKLIGSDFRLFFHNQGFLKNLKSTHNFAKKYKLHFLLVFPGFKSSTKTVYSNVKNYSASNPFLKKKLFSRNKFITYLSHSKNDLQSIVEKRHSKISELLKNISDIKGCYFSRMTGSGSACYGLFTDKNSLKVALKKLRKKYPRLWFSMANTI